MIAGDTPFHPCLARFAGRVDNQGVTGSAPFGGRSSLAGSGLHPLHCFDSDCQGEGPSPRTNDVSPRKIQHPRSAIPLAADPIASAVASVRRLVRVLRLHAQRTQAVAGVSAAQLFVLQQLRTDDSLSLNELAARTFTDRSSVADVVDRLQAQRWVDRATDPSDRRRASVRITTAGRRVLSRAPDAPTTALIAALRALMPHERTALAKSLVRLNQALGAAAEPAPMLFAEADETQARRHKISRAKRR